MQLIVLYQNRILFQQQPASTTTVFGISAYCFFSLRLQCISEGKGFCYDAFTPLPDLSTVMQLREDVTRFRYGDEQHLDDTLTRLFQFNRPKGIPRRCVLNPLSVPHPLSVRFSL